IAFTGPVPVNRDATGKPAASARTDSSEMRKAQMRKIMNQRVAICALSVLASVAVCAQTAQTAATKSPAEISIQKAQEQIAKQPDHVPYYASLAMAYARRARETSDVAYYAKAEETLQRSFKIAPDNFE